MYRLTDITKDGKTRTDGRYPQRIGCLVEILFMWVGISLVLSYLEDADGNKKQGFLKTSLITEIDGDASSDVITVTTLNSVYTLTKA